MHPTGAAHSRAAPVTFAGHFADFAADIGAAGFPDAGPGGGPRLSGFS